MFGYLCKIFYHYIIGWKISGPHPNEIARKVVVVVPHTSGWDLPLGLLVKYSIGLKIQFVGKKSLFKWPFNRFFRMWGLVPIDRSKGQSVVDEIIELYRNGTIHTIGMAPEGTRKKVDKLKTGFYRIAKELDIPVIMIKFDYPAKEVIFSEPLYLTGSKEEMMTKVEDYFRGTIGKIPEYSF